jgi:hypothetical protein
MVEIVPRAYDRMLPFGTKYTKGKGGSYEKI